MKRLTTILAVVLVLVVSSTAVQAKVTWSKIEGIPPDIADGDDDTQLTEAQVDAYVSNNGFVQFWFDIPDIPAGFADGIDDIGGPDSDWIISDSNMYSGVAGKVGIGTLDPAEKLHVSGGNILLDNGYELMFKDSSGNFNSHLGTLPNDELWITNFAGGGIRFLTGPNPGNSGSRVEITKGGDVLIVSSGNVGKVGIGTTSPQSELDVAGSTETEDLWIGDFMMRLATNNYVGGGMLTITGPNGGAFTVPHGDYYPVLGGGIVLGGALSNGGAEICAYNGAEHVTFDLKADCGDGDSAIWLNDNDGTHTLELHSGEGDLGGGTSGGLIILRTAAGAEKVRINGETGRGYFSGKVGIGTTSPQGALDVNGPIYQRGGQLHADYVFELDYQLESIDGHSEIMWRDKHLPALPKAQTDESGNEIVEVGAHRRGIVEELEKAHIYIEQLHNSIKALQEKEAEIVAQRSQIKNLQKEVAELKSLVKRVVK